ncbi:hypothetical protein I3843_02G122300 [Carya illinoinensis]|uniref:Uncharacterized protein n=1 Tax=Carya illinoinensis TaxID=32201 RepID=A0A8T1RGQ4_CARIL|nr:hypothetical protein I3760_02G144600 [Carya illinoinensis]KAG6665192.1 hypothetical protein CIPAW_02G144300 [Carya illinoinensis]KAG7992324.1 hypothetical protein I3843_02G122300 [Carya illinoinensis]
MAGNSIRSIFVSLFVFAVILSPLMVTCDAARFTQRVTRPVCPACVCCTPAPAGSCCRCCATPVKKQSENGSP